MKIKTLNTNVYGKSVGLSIGVVEIPLDGIIEVDDQVGQALIEGSPNWVSAEEVEETEEESVEEGSEQESLENDQEVIELTSDQAKKLKKTLEAMSVEELVAVAKAAKIPAKEYGKFSSKPKILSGFVRNRINTATALVIIGEDEE